MEFRLDDEILRELGNRARAERKRQKLGQKTLAQKAGVSRDTVQRFEADGASTLANLVKICRVLGLIPQLDKLFEAPEFSPKEHYTEAATALNKKR